MFRSFVLIAALAIAAPAVVRAQAPAPAAPPVTTGFDNGFFIQANGGDYRLVFGLMAQVDGRFSVDDPLPITNTFTIRKLRPTFSGRLAKYFDFRVVPDFGSGVTVLQDAYFDTRFSTAFRLRVGKDKTPVGYEYLIGDANIFFPERGFASSLVPGRDVGIQAQGDLAGGKISYSGGVFNGVVDGVSSVADVDANSDKDVAGRILVQPWRTTNTPASAVSGLGFHLGGSVGDQKNGALPVYRTSVGQTYFSYASGTSPDGLRTRVAPAAFYFHKSFGAFGEYALSTQHVAGVDGETRPIANHGVTVTTALSLTGEPVATATTRPQHPFDPAAGQWGAAQVVARFSHLEVDGDAFIHNLAAPNASGRADQWTVGFNWFPTAFTKWYAIYERTTFDKHAPGSRPIENVIVFRGQLAF